MKSGSNVSRASASIAAKRAEKTARAMHPKTGVGGYRIEETQLDEKALSRAQQRFMGMVYAAKKGETPASPEVAKAAAGMSKKAARDFAKTKHAKLPEKVEEDIKQVKGEPDLAQKTQAAKPPQAKPQSQNTSTISQVLLAKQKVDTAQKDLAMKQKMAAQKGVNLASLTAGYEPEGEVIDELTRYAKETGKSFRNKKPTSSGGKYGGSDVNSQAMRSVLTSMGAGRAGVAERGKKKVPGKKPPKAGEYGGPRSPEQKVAMRRAAAQRAQDMMHSRYD